MKQLNSKKIRFPRFDKILVIQPIAEVYSEDNEQQLCLEIAPKYGSVKSILSNRLLNYNGLHLGKPRILRYLVSLACEDGWSFDRQKILKMTKSFDSCQPAHFAQADIDHYFF